MYPKSTHDEYKKISVCEIIKIYEIIYIRIYIKNYEKDMKSIERKRVRIVVVGLEVAKKPLFKQCHLVKNRVFYKIVLTKKYYLF